MAGCQVFNGLPSPDPAAPLPLTGANASAAGASALLLYDKSGSYGEFLAPLAADSGAPAAGFAPVDFGANEEHVFSADRSLLAFASSDTAACLYKCLHVLDLRTWKETIKPVDLSNNSGAWVTLAFNPQNTIIGVALNNPDDPGGDLLMVDLAQDKVVRQVKFSSTVEQMGFTPDGSLAVYGNRAPAAGTTATPAPGIDGTIVPGTTGTIAANQESKMYVTLYDGSSLEVRWNQDLDEVSYGSDFGAGVTADPSQGRFLSPAAVFSPDHSRLYVVAADKPLLVSVDFARQTVQSSDIHPRQGWLERLLTAGAGVAYAKTLNGAMKSAILSLDGKYLYIVGQTNTAAKDQNGDWFSQVTPMGLQVVDLSDGAEVGTLASGASDVRLSLDGKTLLLVGYDWSSSGASQPWTDLMDAATLKVTRRFDSELTPTRLLDGSLALLSTIWSDSGANQMAIYDPGSLTMRSQRQGTAADYAAWAPIP
jgi:hypothetical protein